MLDRRLAVDPNLVFNAPLRQLDGATFMSREQNGISCANSLAKWQLKSLLWDGSNSIINCGNDIRIGNIFDGGGTISVWINPKSDGENSNGYILAKINGWILHCRGESAGKIKIRFFYDFDGTDGSWDIATAIIPINTWTHIVISYDNDAVANNPTFYIDGVPYTVASGLTEVTTPVGTRVSDASVTLYLGNTSEINRTIDGNMTDIRLYDRILSGIEIQRIYDRTKRFFC